MQVANCYRGMKRLVLLVMLPWKKNLKITNICMMPKRSSGTVVV